MSRRLVWTAILSLLALGAWCGAASAQYAGNGYPDRYDYDYDPGYGGGSAYRPFDDPANRAPRGYGDPQAYNNGYDQAPPEPRYVDPGYGAQGYGTQGYGSQGYGSQGNGGPASDYDLGPSIRQRTVTEVANETHQPAGTIVIDTASRYLYFTQPDGRALRYGIGVGRQGFAWKGTARVARKAEWPDWVPPSDMLKRRPDLPLRMAGGMDNPLGARAMYLYQGNRDTMFRIHGTNEPDTIGKAVSSGCIRMMNGDVIDLYSRVPVGTRVVVL